jgi:nicotinamidase/pyrazinamidase
MRAGEALLIVDVQNDFCPGGLLPVPEGDKIIPTLNYYIWLFSSHHLPIIASRDWHSEKTIHFLDYGGIWPRHCVRNTVGAAFHHDLELPSDAIIISKGTHSSDADAYSAFQGRASTGEELNDVLATRDIHSLYVGGLATDYCVKHSVEDGLALGFKVYLLTDAIKGVNFFPDDSERAIQEMKQRGAELVSFRHMVDIFFAGSYSLNAAVRPLTRTKTPMNR